MRRPRLGCFVVLFGVCLAGRARAIETGVSDSRVSLPGAPGSVDGVADNARVTPNTGAMTFSVPLEVPEGFAGVTPALALTYSSFAGDGPVGIGWDLPVPTIERTTARGLPAYAATDEIAYGGGEVLVALPDAGTGVAEYRARFERSFMRYRWRDRGDGKQGSWSVEDPGGVVTYYGADAAGTAVASARLATAAKGTFRYYPVESVDRFGHRLVYEWATDPLPASASPDAQAVPLLRSLTWVFVAGQPTYKVAFAYGERARTESDCDPGFETLLTKQLTGVTVTAHGQTRRRTVLTYEPVTASGGLTRLARVESFGVGDLKDPVVHDFGHTQALGAACAEVACMPSVVQVPLAGVNPSLKAGHTTLVDLNGDALPDVIDTTAPKHKLLLSKLGVDGKAAFQPVATSAFGGGHDLASPYVQVLDVDGDGFVDLLNAQTSSVLVNGGAATGDWTTERPLAPAATNAALGELIMRDGPNTRFLDVDGDRRVDALHLTRTSAEVYLNGAGGFALDTAHVAGVVGFDFATDGLQLADMNGDGQQDLVQVTEAGVSFWLGLGWGQWGPKVSAPLTITPTERPAVELEDLNGDQLADVVIVQGNQVKYALNATAGAFSAWAMLAGTDPRYADLPTVTPDTVSVLFADMNGNGSTDVVWVDAAGKLTYLELFPVRPNLLTRVTNGLGLVTDVRYGTTLEQQGRSTTPWAHRLPHAMTVVTELRHLEPVSMSTQSELYAYTDAYYDPLYKQFRGFSGVEIAEEADPAQEAGRTTLTFDVGATDAYRAGLALGEKLESAGRTLYVESRTYVECPIDGVTDGSGVKFVCPLAKTRALVEGRPEAEWVATETRYAYDKNGNVSTESHLGVTAIGGGGCAACAPGPTGLSGGPCGALCEGDELRIDRTYVAPTRATGGWILDALAVEKISGPAQGPTAERRYYYDGEAFEGLALGKLEKGASTRVEVVSGAAGETVQLERRRTDADGNTVELLDALGVPGGAEHRATTAYDPTGLRPVSATVFLKDAAGPYELRRTMAYDAVWDQPTEESDWSLVRGATTTPAASTKRFAYDGLGRLVATAETPSALDAPDETLSYEYGAAPSRVIRRTRSKAGGALDLQTVRCLDGKGRLFQERKRVADGRFLVSGFTAYNARDGITRAYQPYEGTTDACDVAAPAGVAHVGYFRDAAERQLRATMPDAASLSRVEYGPLAVTTFGQNDSPGAGAPTPAPETRTYDGLGRVLSVARAGGAAGSLVSRFFYDGLGRLGAVVDPARAERRQEYDQLGRPVRVTDADTGTTTFEYDALGNRTRRVDATGAATRTTYDGLERRVAEWIEGAEAETRVDFSYDVAPAACGADACPNVAGRLAAIAYPIGTGRGGETFGYDVRGWQTRFGRSFGAAAAGRAKPDLGVQRFDVSLAYDNAGRLTGTDYPGGLHVAYEYDGVGRLLRVPGLLEGLKYTARGDTSEIAFANGVKTTMEVDVDGQLSAVRTKDKAAAAIVALTYDRDNEGQIVAIHDEAARAGAPSAEAAFTYDRLHRLVAARLDVGRAGAEDVTYAYDTQENLSTRTSSRTTSAAHLGALTYDAAHPHRVAKAGARTFAFDAAGRTTARGADKLRWDGRGRLAGVSRGAADVAAYFYGATRDRLVKVEDGHQTLHVTPDFDVRDGHGIFYLRVSGQLMAKVETPALATTVLSDVAPASVEGKAATPAPDGAITAGDAWVAQAGAAGVLELGAAKTSDVDALLASSARRLLAGAETTTTFFHADHEGSVVAATDEAGAVTFRAAYYPHGDVRAAVGAPPEDVRYTGKERDQASGLVAFGARYADLETGRWLSPDPHYELLLDEDTTERPEEASSRYGFAANDPVNRVDRDGRFAWWVVGAAIGAATSMCVEIWRQVTYEGKITSGRNVLIKGALGMAFGALSAGASSISTVASAATEIATYKALKKATLQMYDKKTLSAAQEKNVRKIAVRAGLGVGLLTGLGIGSVAGLADAWMSSVSDASFSEGIDGATASALATETAQYTSLFLDPATEKLAEMGTEAWDNHHAAKAKHQKALRALKRSPKRIAAGRNRPMSVVGAVRK